MFFQMGYALNGLHQYLSSLFGRTTFVVDSLQLFFEITLLACYINAALLLFMLYHFRYFFPISLLHVLHTP